MIDNPTIDLNNVKINISLCLPDYQPHVYIVFKSKEFAKTTIEVSRHIFIDLNNDNKPIAVEFYSNYFTFFSPEPDNNDDLEQVQKPSEEQDLEKLLLEQDFINTAYSMCCEETEKFLNNKSLYKILQNKMKYLIKEKNAIY